MNMQTANLVPANEFCRHHNIEFSFISTLQDHGLIEITRIQQDVFIPDIQLPKLEKIIRLYFDLDINLEGIEAIDHLLEQVEKMQEQLRALRNRLKLYEESEE